jgi:hypothetical protein
MKLDYEEILDAAIRRSGAITTAIESGSFHLPPTDEEGRRRRETLRWRIEREEADEYVKKVLGRVASAEAKIRTARARGAKGKHVVELTKRVYAELVASVERDKQKTFEKLVAEIDRKTNAAKAREAMPSADSVAAESLALRKAELRLASVDGAGATGRLNTIENRGEGYDPAEVLVLGSKSAEANAIARTLTTQLPPHLADRDGVGLLKELAEFAETPIGYFKFNFDGKPETTSIGAMFAPDVEPVAEDFIDAEPVGGTK